MAVIKLKSEKRIKQVDTSSELANTYESGDVVYDSAGSKFRTSNGSAWSDLTISATVADIGTIGNVDSFASASADQGKLAVVKNGADEIDFIPMHSFSSITVAIGAGDNTALTTQLNGSLSGTIVVNNTSQNSGGTASGKGVMVNINSLSAYTKSNPRFEILSGTSSLGFRFKADTTAIDSFGGQAQITAGTGDTDGISVSDAQKLVLLYTGSAWQYMIQSI